MFPKRIAARACDGIRVIAVDDKIDVDVTVAGVAEVGDKGVVLFADLFDAGDKLRHL